jgi:prevent-host-death family protein
MTFEDAMEKTVSAADANRRFSDLLRGVKEDHSYVDTSHGRPVAKLISATTDKRNGAAARSALLAQLKSQPTAQDDKARKRWTRDELYEDE